MVGLDDVRLALWRLSLDDEGLEQAFATLETWHRGERNPEAGWDAHRQTLVLSLLRDGRSQAEVAERLQISLRRVERDVALIKRVYGIAGRARRVESRNDDGLAVIPIRHETMDANDEAYDIAA